jgi:nitrate/nitrite transporter NarK
VQLEVSLDRRGSAGLVGALGTIGAGFVIGVTGAIVEPTGAAAVVGLVAGIAGAAALVCRALWARSTAGHRRRPGRVADAVAALPPSEKPPEG